MQLQAWCQLDLHVHLLQCLYTHLAVFFFYSQRVLEHQMQLQAWCQMDIRTHIMHRLHTNLIALLFCLHTYDHALVAPQQAGLDLEDSTTASSNSKLRQKRRKTVPKNKSKLRKRSSAVETVDSLYRTLGTDEFRLLIIAPGDKDAPLVCTLEHESFQSNKWYYALSYTWGSPEPPFFMNCNGSDIRITKSLHEALCQMRRAWCHLTVWADAICINQSDNTEKSRQVSRMGDIYSKAGRLFIWLGNPITASASDADVTVDTMEKLQSQFADRTEISRDRGRTIVAVQESMREAGISENEWQKVQDCFLMPWFSRVWVFQEVVSVSKFRGANNILVGYGNRIFPWSTVIHIMSILGPLKSVDPASIRCPVANAMNRNISVEVTVPLVRIHLTNDRITEEDVVKAVANTAIWSGRPNFQFGAFAQQVTIVVDICRVLDPYSNKDQYPQMDLDTEVSYMKGVFLRLFPDGSYPGIPRTLHCQ